MSYWWILALAFLGIFVTLRTSSADNSEQSRAIEAMQALRQRALKITPEDLKLPASYPHDVLAVIIDTALGDGKVYTLVCMADGSTSIYFSSGGGFIGLGEHADIKAKTLELISAANQTVGDASPTTTFDFPEKNGHVIFYFPTKKRGIYVFDYNQCLT